MLKLRGKWVIFKLDKEFSDHNVHIFLMWFKLIDYFFLLINVVLYELCFFKLKKSNVNIDLNQLFNFNRLKPAKTD